MTLNDYIEERNRNFEEYEQNHAINSNDFHLESSQEQHFSQSNMIEYIEIFLSIIKGVNFIHSHQNMIHRDLKPSNILFTFEDLIKISDFGLATNSMSNSYEVSENYFLIPSPTRDNLKHKKKLLSELCLEKINEHDNNCGFNSKYVFGEVVSPIHSDKNLIKVDTAHLAKESLKCLQNIDRHFFDAAIENEEQSGKGKDNKIPKNQNNNKFNERVNCNSLNYHTKDVGTIMYSAPEQLNDNHYNQKVRIF